jgi:hypothetical protein
VQALLERIAEEIAERIGCALEQQGLLGVVGGVARQPK